MVAIPQGGYEMDMVFLTSMGISSIAVVIAVILMVIQFKRQKEFRHIREKDAKTIRSLTSETIALRDEIINKLNLLCDKEVEQKKVLSEIIVQRAEGEGQHKEDIMNWLEYKAKRWQDQIESRVTERLSRIHEELKLLTERLTAIETKDRHMDEK